MKKNKRGKKKKKIKIIILLLFVALILANSIFLFLYNHFKTKDELKTCGDGTFYDTCSLRKPYFCKDGILIEMASLCGCPDGFQTSNNSCFSELYTSKKTVSLKYTFKGKPEEIKINVYGGINDYLSNLSREIFFPNEKLINRRDFKLKAINNKLQRDSLSDLIVQIQNRESKKEQQLRIAVSIVQNIPYNFSEKKELFENKLINHSRYPYEVLYENSGTCSEKSLLLSAILRELGYSVAILYFPKENHEAVGVKCPLKRSIYETGYCFIETSGPSIISDYNIIFSNGQTLSSKPEVYIIAEGIELPNDMKEYKDAKILNEIRSRSILGLIYSQKFDNLKKEYNLLEEEYKIE
ncbi:MAG: hypothetical protein QXU40_01665 [Candidatus Pacearchaeota archaeon]